MEKIKRTELDSIIGMLDEVIDDCVPYTRSHNELIRKSFTEKQDNARKCLKLVEHIFYGSFVSAHVDIEVIADGEEGDEDNE